MNRHKVKDIFREGALAVRMPQFFIRVQNGGFFEDEHPFQVFEREELLKAFRLSQADATISFEDVETEVYRVDLEQIGDENYTVGHDYRQLHHVLLLEGQRVDKADDVFSYTATRC